jgi:hypothetical protein
VSERANKEHARLCEVCRKPVTGPRVQFTATTGDVSRQTPSMCLPCMKRRASALALKVKGAR